LSAIYLNIQEGQFCATTDAEVQNNQFGPERNIH